MSEYWQLGFLGLTGVAAGFVDSIAGGGGLITLPVMLNFFPNPQLALGTNKLQAVFGSGSAAFHYTRAGLADVRECRRAFILTFIGATIGSVFIQQINPDFLRKMIPVLLVAVALYALFKPQLGDKDIHPRMTRLRFDVLFGLVFGFYDGFFGPGVGTFWTMAFMLGLGFNMTKATANTKVVNFASNLASFIFFVLYGHMNVPAGLAMGIGQLMGTRIGAHMVVRRGTKLIRPIFIVVVLAITGKLLYQAFRH